MFLAALGIIAWQGILYYREEASPRTRILLTTALSTSAAPASATAAQTTILSDMAAAAEPTQTTTAEAIVTTATTAVQFPLDLNQATATQLEAIPGIGSALSQRVVDYRAQIGGYTSLEQLLDVEGIGQSRYTTMLEYVYLEGDVTNPVTTVSKSTPKKSRQTTTRAKSTTAPEATVTTAQTASTTVTETTAATAPLPPAPHSIDLNAATKEDLMRIDAIDETLADAILDFKDQISYFSSVYELLYVDGLGRATFSQIEQYFYVSSQTD